MKVGFVWGKRGATPKKWMANKKISQKKFYWKREDYEQPRK